MGKLRHELQPKVGWISSSLKTCQYVPTILYSTAKYFCDSKWVDNLVSMIHNYRLGMKSLLYKSECAISEVPISSFSRFGIFHCSQHNHHRPSPQALSICPPSFMFESMSLSHIGDPYAFHSRYVPSLLMISQAYVVWHRQEQWYNRSKSISLIPISYSMTPHKVLAQANAGKHHTMSWDWDGVANNLKCVSPFPN